MIVLNNSKDLYKTQHEAFLWKHSKAHSKDILTDTVIDITSEIELGPKSVLILELQISNTCFKTYR
jgi:hypothetical protein